MKPILEFAIILLFFSLYFDQINTALMSRRASIKRKQTEAFNCKLNIKKNLNVIFI